MTKTISFSGLAFNHCLSSLARALRAGVDVAHLPFLLFQPSGTRLRSTGRSPNSSSSVLKSLPVSQATLLVSCASGRATICRPFEISGEKEMRVVWSVRRRGEETRSETEEWYGNHRARLRHCCLPRGVRMGSLSL